MIRIISILWFLIPFICISQTIKGKVVRISDGDTITVLDSSKRQIRIRLYGIDCPENGQDFGNVAKKYTSELCFAKIVTVNVKDKDQYGRIVGVVWTEGIDGNGTTGTAAIVLSGGYEDDEDNGEENLYLLHT